MAILKVVLATNLDCNGFLGSVLSVDRGWAIEWHDDGVRVAQAHKPGIRNLIPWHQIRRVEESIEEPAIIEPMVGNHEDEEVDDVPPIDTRNLELAARMVASGVPVESLPMASMGDIPPICKQRRTRRKKSEVTNG